MANAVVIVGNGDFAKMLYRYLAESQDYNVLGFVVESLYLTEKEIYGLPVVPIEEIGQSFPKEKVQLVMGIGYKKMGNIKKKIYNLLKDKKYIFTNYIHPTAVIFDNVVLGEGNTIFEKVLIQEGVSIGNCNLIYGNSVVGHESILGNYNSVSLNVTIAGCVNIADNCFIGASSTLKDHITIHEYALIGAATYCSKNMESYSVLAAPQSTILEGKESTDFI